MKIFGAIKPYLRQGIQYVKNEADEIFTTRTNIGRKLAEGASHARQAVRTRMKSLNNSSDDMITDFKRKVQINGFKAKMELSQDPDFMRDITRYRQKTGILDVTRGSKTDEQYYQELIETGGIGPTKLAQIISSDESILSKIEDPALVEAIKKTKDECSFSRTIEEAQEIVSANFPGVTIQSELNAGSIGAAYLVKRADGTDAVVKMIKKGVDAEQLELEERITLRLIDSLELGATVKEREKIVSMLKSWYKDWAEELDFSVEMKNNKLLANGAKRYRVANITDISEDCTSILMDKANGITMKKLVKMLSCYKNDGNDVYLRTYSKEIAENPWLAKPDKVISELPTVVLKTFDEQFMFMKKGQQSLMHGDPHTGNFFITTDKKGRLIPEFIDTGNCVRRSAKQIKKDVNFFANYFVGNPEEIARYYIEQCAYKGDNLEEIVAKVAKEIQEEILGQKHNVAKFDDFQKYITYILERNGLQMLPENATATKAQMQFFTAIAEAGKLSGQSFNMLTIIKDIPRAAWGMVKAGVNPWSSIKQALKFAYQDVEKAASIAYQFIIKKGDIDYLA